MLAVHIWRVRKDGFAVQRAERRRVRRGGDRASGRAGAPRHGAGRAGAVRRARRACSASSTASRSPRRTARSTTPCSPGRTCSCVTSSSRSASRPSCSALGVAFAAPLRGLANPNVTPEPAKAPWYFAGLQELLSHFDPLVAGILVPPAPCWCSCCCRTSTATRRPRRATARSRSLLFSVLLAIAVVLTVIGTFFRGPGLEVHRPVDPLVHRALGGRNGRQEPTRSSCATAGRSAARC